MNSKDSKISDPHKLLLSLTDKIYLKRKHKYIASSNCSIYYTWKNVKKLYKKSNLIHQLQNGANNLNYLIDHILYQKFKIIVNIYLKSMGKRQSILK